MKNHNSGALILGAILVSLLFAGFIGLIFVILPHLHESRQFDTNAPILGEYAHSYVPSSSVIGRVDGAAASMVAQPNVVPLWIYTPRYARHQEHYAEVIGERGEQLHSASNDDNMSVIGQLLSVVYAASLKTGLIILGFVVPVLIMAGSCICGVIRRVGGRVFKRRAGTLSAAACHGASDQQDAVASAIAVAAVEPVSPIVSECCERSNEQAAVATATVVVDTPTNMVSMEGIVHIESTAAGVGSSGVDSCACACATKRRVVGDVAQSAGCACLSCSCRPCGCASRQH